MASEAEQEKGRAVPLWHLVCGICGGVEPTYQENNRDALATARLRGWERKRSTGWTCPEDLGKERGGDYVSPENWPGGRD